VLKQQHQLQLRSRFNNGSGANTTTATNKENSINNFTNISRQMEHPAPSSFHYYLLHQFIIYFNHFRPRVSHSVHNNTVFTSLLAAAVTTIATTGFCVTGHFLLVITS